VCVYVCVHVCHIGESVMTAELLDHVIGLIETHGSDCWWDLPPEALLPPSLRERGAPSYIYSYTSLSPS
jgi:hypothetical protein